jgi:hypothetical protein
MFSSTVSFHQLLSCSGLMATTKQHASDAANEHIYSCHTPEQEKNSINKTVKLKKLMTAAQYQPKKPAAVSVGF